MSRDTRCSSSCPPCVSAGAVSYPTALIAWFRCRTPQHPPSSPHFISWNRFPTGLQASTAPQYVWLLLESRSPVARDCLTPSAGRERTRMAIHLVHRDVVIFHSDDIFIMDCAWPPSASAHSPHLFCQKKPAWRSSLGRLARFLGCHE